MNYQHAANVLCALPSGTKVVITSDRGDTLNGEARDRPAEGRRYTVNFFEWFITPEGLENLGVTNIQVLGFDI